MRRVLFFAILALPALVLASSRAEAYGAVHAGYTHVGPTGNVQHVGYTAAAAPTGAVSHTGATSVGGGGAYHTGSTSAYGVYGGAYHESTRAYSPTIYGGYSAAGPPVTAYSAGVIRYP